MHGVVGFGGVVDVPVHGVVVFGVRVVVDTRVRFREKDFFSVKLNSVTPATPP
jgi:hypothetical protein